jgi:hypothetical protein
VTYMGLYQEKAGEFWKDVVINGKWWNGIA